MEIWKVWELLHAKNPNYLTNFVDGNIYPFINRLRGRENHLPLISKINRMLFSCPPKVLHSILFLSIIPDPWVGKPKATKYDEKKLDVVKHYIKDIYGWSEKEFNNNKKIVIKLLNNKDFLKELNYHVSLEKKEAKVLGVEFVKYKPKPRNKETSVSLANF